MSLTVMRRLRFNCGHRLLNYPGKCAHFHGHNYVADIYVRADQQDELGRVIDFSVLKKLFGGWLDEHWDHSFLLWEADTNGLAAIRMVEPERYFVMPFNPTAENMARYLLETVAPGLMEGTGARCVQIVLWETEDSFAVVSTPEATGLGITPLA